MPISRYRPSNTFDHVLVHFVRATYPLRSYPITQFNHFLSEKKLLEPSRALN